MQHFDFFLLQNVSSASLEGTNFAQSKRQLVSNSTCSVGSSFQILSPQDGSQSKSDSNSPRDGYLLISKQAQIDNWLTEIEIRLIQLQPFASGLDETEQISKIQVFLSMNEPSDFVLMICDVTISIVTMLLVLQ